MIPRSASTVARPIAFAMVSLIVALILVTLAPFAAALEVHHELAAADQDGHQHSDSDLCQWVQHHTASSMLVCAPAVESHVSSEPHQYQPPRILLSVRLIQVGPSRAPPLS
ncbi:MAG: hypothetical protein ACREI2_01640 [Nitrospiraceae bacterium]